MGLQKLVGPASILTLVVTEVVLLYACYFVGALLVVPNDLVVFLLYHSGLTRISILVAAIVVALYFQDLYEDVQVHAKMELFQQVCLAAGLAFLLQAVLNYADSRLVFPRWMMLVGSFLALVTIPTWRILHHRTIRSAALCRRVLFLGANSLARDLALHLRVKPELGVDVIGFLGEEGANEGCEPILGPVAGCRQIVELEKPDILIVALKIEDCRELAAELLDLKFHGQAIEDIGHVYERALRRVCVPRLREASLILSGELGPRQHLMVLQGLYNRLFAVIGLSLSLPILLLTVLAVKLTSAGPVLFRQRRVGLRGKPFNLYKFRSMYIDAESKTGAVWAKKNDPRITPVGRWLRRFRIDEIPQLFNALRGDMSIVGPRPERPEFVEILTEAIPFYRQRLIVKPGITGWAQINYKYGDSIEDTVTKLEYDLYYVKSLTPMIDLYIMFHTAKVVLLGRGAQ